MRGILTLGFLDRIERLLRARHGKDPSFRLCHYFDLIGGTSTGAIIAAGLALGFSVERLTNVYRELAAAVFRKRWYRFGIFDAKFPTGPLQEALESQFGEVRLGDDEVLTGLMIMAKRLDTGSPWVIHNHPKSRYFDPKPPSTAYPNKLYSLKQVVRASTAAPHYFEPERIRVAERVEGGRKRTVEGAFIDGGVSPHNNPALQLFMLATMSGYAWKWSTGADRLLLISVGTGGAEPRLETDEVMDYAAADLARRALLSLMDDCSVLSHTILQWISRCDTRTTIDREIGDLANDCMSEQQLLRYERYNVDFGAEWIASLKPPMDQEVLSGLKAMDNPANIEELYRLGSAAADMQVKEGHFPESFNVGSKAG